MKTAEKRSPSGEPASPSLPSLSGRSGSPKVLASHLEKLAIVYVRQSTPKQVLENRESTARQYAFAEQAVAYGWSPERVVTIDDDLGKSAKTTAGRSGFERLVTEVTLNHVGMVLGLEMSRLARSSKDWHAFFEMCAIFGTLIADEDGVYDGNDPNDRLLLGLKGIMSEMELHIMRNRLEHGRDNKARRGELFHGVPMGYVVLPTGELDFDPDEQARAVVQLVFDKFEELGTIYGVFYWLLKNDIQLPIRARTGAKKGQLDWRRPSIPTLAQMLRHPIYAGAYSYGRRPTDPKRKFAPNQGYRPWVPMEQWRVLIKDHHPAYITWEQYLKNRKRIKQNQNRPDAPGVPRRGAALLPGVLVCGNCGRHMQASYHRESQPHYACGRYYVEGTEPRCYGLAGTVLDNLVAQQVLRALEPAALALSLQAHADIEKERQRLHKHWQQRLQRVRYEVELAERRYQAVDPSNRLVAASLEKRWEEALAQQRHVQEEYDRFVQETPHHLSDAERARITALSSDLPALWQAPSTTNADRKQIIRCLVERVVVQVRCDSELVGVTIHWVGGYASQHEIVRPVATYAQLRDFESLMKRVVELREAGQTAPQIAQALNAEGFYPPKRSGQFTTPVVHQLLKRRGLIGNERRHNELVGKHEWWLTDLARELKMSHLKLRDWANRGWVHSRKTPVQGYWILWADKDEVRRLRRLLAESRRGMNTYTSALKTPKKRSAAPS
jgi:DNA invertase Pin-like site-specific DNA recombinase